jgi:hypothetical protein
MLPIQPYCSWQRLPLWWQHVLNAKRPTSNSHLPRARQVRAPDGHDDFEARLSTIVGGVYWKPIYNLLDGTLAVLVVNAQHIKQVPGRKTDVSDAAWIAGLLRHGLLQPSFVPDREPRELRDLTR